MFYLVRHGQSEGNVRTDLWEWAECTLTARGQAQMERLAARLAGAGLDAIYASTMRRARDSAQFLATASGLPVVHVDWLREMDFGRLNLTSMDDVQAHYPHLLDRFGMTFDTEFPGGESLRSFYDRVGKGVKDLLAALTPPRRVALVGHAGSLEVIVNVLLDLPLIPFDRFDFYNASLTILKLEQAPSGWQPRLILLNDTCHEAGL